MYIEVADIKYNDKLMRNVKGFKMGSFGLYFGWDWFLWLGLWIVILSSFGNWGYTYSAHRKFNNMFSPKSTVNILNERYASGAVPPFICKLPA